MNVKCLQFVKWPLFQPWSEPHVQFLTPEWPLGVHLMSEIFHFVLTLSLRLQFFIGFSLLYYLYSSSCCTTGVIKTALPNMDREVKEQYQVLIQAKDMGGQLGGLAGTTTVNITLSDVNDNPPRFSKSECCSRVNIEMKRLFNNNNNAGDNMLVRTFHAVTAGQEVFIMSALCNCFSLFVIKRCHKQRPVYLARLYLLQPANKAGLVLFR